MGMDVSVKDGGCQIEYENQEPRIHGIYLEELGEVRRQVGHGQIHRRSATLAIATPQVALRGLERK